MKQLPEVILRQLAHRVIELSAITFGVRGVGKPLAVRILPDNLIEISPKRRRTKVGINIQWLRLRGVFDTCESICVGLEEGKKVFEVKGSYEGRTTTIRIYCIPR
jgi:hypothetical protein